MQDGGYTSSSTEGADSINLSTLLDSLPPAFRQLAPGIVKSIIDGQRSKGKKLLQACCRCRLIALTCHCPDH